MGLNYAESKSLMSICSCRTAATVFSEQEASLTRPGRLCSVIDLQTSDGVTLRSLFLPFDPNPQWQIPSSQSSEVAYLHRIFLYQSSSGGYACYCQTTPPRATVILFHGNGYHAWDYLDVAQNFARLKCNVLLLEYRGSVELRNCIPPGVPFSHRLRLPATEDPMGCHRRKASSFQRVSYDSTQMHSTPGLRRDAQAALDYVLADPVLSQCPIVSL